MGAIYQPSGPARDYAHWAVNLYKGCGFCCDYCFGPTVMRNPEFHSVQTVKKDVLKRLRKEAPKLAGMNNRVLLCFGCDPYQQLDDYEKITRQAISILRDNNIPFQILTKGGMRAARDFDLYGPDDMFGSTLTLLDEAGSRAREPYAALPDDRISAIVEAKEGGIQTFVSLEPVIETETSLEIIRRTHTFVDQFRIGKMNYYDRFTARTWRNFGIAAIRLCRELKASYFIKAELAKFLDGIPFHNTDMRKVK